MKKSIFLLAAGAMALTACTQSEVIEEGVQSNAIGFQNTVGKETRALDKTSLNHFNVYAYYTPENGSGAVQVFSGDEVTLSGTTWTYTNTRYWVPGAQYYFYAYSCENNDLQNGSPVMNLDGDTPQARALRINDFICNDDHQHDFIIAKNISMTGKDTSGDKDNPANSKVALNFKHILTKINVVFTSEFAPGYNIVIGDVKVTNIRDKGNYSAASESWNNQARTKTENFAEGDYGTFVKFAGFVEGKNIASKGETAADNVTAKTTDCYVLPYSYTTEGDVKLRFNIEVVDATTNQTILEREMVGSWNPSWVLGTSYTYTVKITGTTADLEPIVFETQENMNVDDWATGSTTTAVSNMTFSAN